MKGKADRNIRRLVSGLWTVFEICCRQNMKMNVLVINCGSSSLKYQLINSDSEAVLAKGLCERIGIDGRLVYQKTGCDKEITEAAMPTHKEAIQMVLDALTNDKTGAIGSLKEVNAVGHRVVHGGEKFAKSVVYIIHNLLIFFLQSSCKFSCFHALPVHAKTSSVLFLHLHTLALQHKNTFKRKQQPRRKLICQTQNLLTRQLYRKQKVR